MKQLTTGIWLSSVGQGYQAHTHLANLSNVSKVAPPHLLSITFAKAPRQLADEVVPHAMWLNGNLTSNY